MNFSGYFLEIITPRCVLRVLKESDVTPEYVGWLNDPQVNQYLESRFSVHSAESVRHVVRRALESSNDVLLGIFMGEVFDLHIGNIRLYKIDLNNATAEIGFMIGREDFWGKGIATEAIGHLCDWAFREIGLQKVIAGAHSDNLGSQKALLRAGFIPEATLRSHAVTQSGARTDVILFAHFSKQNET